MFWGTILVAFSWRYELFLLILNRQKIKIKDDIRNHGWIHNK